MKLQADLSLRSLHALCCLQKVDGSLVRQSMYNLGNVDGLSSLTEIGGDLSVTHSNCGTLNLKRLGSVQRVGGNFEVERDECYLLTKIGPRNIAGSITHTSSGSANSCGSQRSEHSPRQRKSHPGHSAIEHDLFTGHEGGIIGGQVERDLSHFFGSAEALERDLRNQALGKPGRSSTAAGRIILRRSRPPKATTPDRRWPECAGNERRYDCDGPRPD